MNNQQILSQVASEAAKAQNGEIDILEVYAKINELEKGVKELKNSIKDEAIEKRSRFGEKEQVIKGDYEIQLVSQTRYYSNAYKDDSQHEMLKQKMKNREALMKKAYSMNEPLFDEETGEIIPKAKPSHSEYVKCTYLEPQL